MKQATMFVDGFDHIIYRPKTKLEDFQVLQILPFAPGKSAASNLDIMGHTMYIETILITLDRFATTDTTANNPQAFADAIQSDPSKVDLLTPYNHMVYSTVKTSNKLVIWLRECIEW